MTGIISEIASSFYVTQLSVGSIILTVFALYISVFFLRLRNLSSATIHLGLAFAFFTVFHFSYFISFSFYHPLTAYHRWFTVSFVLFTEIHMCRFILQYPDDRNRRLSQGIMLIQYCLLTPVIIWYFIFTSSAQTIYRFDGHYWDFNSDYISNVIGLVIIINNAIFIISFIIKLIQLKNREFYWMLWIGLIFIIGSFIPAILNTMNLNGYTGREAFHTTLNMCHLFTFALMALMHLSTTKDRFSYLGKIVGASCVTFLAIFILNSHFTLLEMDSLFEKLKYSDSRIIISEGREDTGIKFLNSYYFKENRIIYGEKTSVDTAYSRYEYFNTAVYEEIKNLPDYYFTSEFHRITKDKDQFFSGYENLILSFDRSIPSGFANRGIEICRRIESLQGYLQYNYDYIKHLPDEGFRDNMLLYLQKTTRDFRVFSDAMRTYTESSILQGGELKQNVLHFIEAMKPSGSLRYRTGTGRSNYVSSIYYDKTKNIVYEAGFSYLTYREFMRKPALRMVVLTVTIMIFMVFIYPLFFLWTLYFPLNSLLEGVKKVSSGNLDFTVPISAEDEIGFITGSFNTMVEKLKENRDTIFRSENRFRELNDLLPDIIYETDMNLNITYLNKAGSDQTGYTDNDIAEGLSFHQLLNHEEMNLLEKFIRADNNRYTDIFSMTHDLRTGSGKIIRGENRAVFICDSNKPSGLRGIIRDVTDKLRTEEALLQLQKMETIGTLVAGLTHDFNNILGGITGPLSLLLFSLQKKGSLQPDNLDLHLNTMNESVKRAVDLVQQLVVLSRREAPHLIPVDAREPIEHIVRICSSAFDKSIEISKRLPDGEIMIKADPTQLEQMLLNICINANHAMTIMRNPGEQPGGKLIIAVSRINSDEHFKAIHPEAAEGPYWNLTVTDTGVGMDSDTISKIFIPFYTTKERGSGTGLGLAMVYNIIRHHNGFIDVYSEPGSGTSFNIYIPLLDEEHDLSLRAAEIIPRGEGTILIADDEESIRLTSRLMLEKCGYKVLTACDGEEAIKIYTENSSEIKAVLLDFLMPKISGDEVYRKLIVMNPDVKVLLASGMLNDDRVERMSLNQGCMFIQKPYTFENLAWAVYNLLIRN